jgi:anaerobic dimethyl sulfoxide reductase subunit A
MIGSVGVPGGGIPSEMGSTTAPRVMAPFLDFKRQPADYNPPILLNWNKWAAAVLLREKYDKKEITKDDFYRRIGNACDNPMPNLKMRLDLGYMSNSANNSINVREHIEALKKQEFVVVCASIMHLTAKYADIVLPIANPFFEQDHYRDEYQVTGLNNFIIFSPKKTEPFGEAKSRLWICTKIAERLGFVDKYNPAYRGDDKWDEMSEELHREAYNRCAGDEATREIVGKMPSWDEFKKKSVIRFPIKRPYIALQDQIEKGTPFPTESGKIEFYSELAAQINEETYYGNKISPLARWTPGGWGTFTDQNAHRYPLMMLTPHPQFRQHSYDDSNPLLRDEYRHGVWMNPADAKMRGIVDNDLVKVYNDLGAMVIPAYVTSRVIPGVVTIYHGAWYEPDDQGIDRRGAPNVLVHNEHIPQTTNRVLRVTDLIEIEKAEEEQK